MWIQSFPITVTTQKSWILFAIVSYSVVCSCNSFQIRSTTGSTDSTLNNKLFGRKTFGSILPSVQSSTSTGSSWKLYESSNVATNNDEISSTIQDQDPTEETEADEPEFTWSDQWYPIRPISYLEDIGNTAIPFRLLGRNLVLWKSNSNDTSICTNKNMYTVMEDECPHRKAPLSTGKVVNDGCNLMCRFHGWTFNENGQCTDIPMYLTTETKEANVEGNNTSSTDEKYTKLLSTIKVTTYPTQIAGGLLWVYLQKYIHSIVKPLDTKMISESTTDFIYNIVPVGYTSMVENSFDPSHAPFIHEGTSDPMGGKFTPANAIPMKEYTLIPNTTLTSSGFTMIHTPYTNTAKTTMTSRTTTTTVPITTTRQFLSPTVQKTIYPFFNLFLYFVPISVRETLVIGTVPAQFIPPHIAKFVPKQYHEYVMDWIHYLFVIQKSTAQFYQQDMVTMRLQDSRKLLKSKLNPGTVIVDMAPTPADRGINIFQKWLRSVAKGGPFNDPIAIISTADLNEPRALNMYEYHGKFCPRCKRCIQRLSTIEKNSIKLSRISLLGSTIFGMIVSIIKRSTASSTLTIPLFGCTISIIAHLIGNKMKSLRERMYSSLEVTDITDVYAF